MNIGVLCIKLNITICIVIFVGGKIYYYYDYRRQRECNINNLRNNILNTKQMAIYFLLVKAIKQIKLGINAIHSNKICRNSFFKSIIAQS